MDNNKLSAIIENNQSEEHLKYIKEKVNEIVNSKHLEKLFNMDIIYKNLTESLVYKLGKSENKTTTDFMLDIGETFLATVKKSKDTPIDEQDAGPTVVDEDVIDCLNELLTLDNLGSYLLSGGVGVRIFSNYVFIRNEYGSFKFSRVNQDKYTLCVSEYNYSISLNKYYNDKGIFFSKGYYPRYHSYSNNDVIYVVGLNKEKVDEVQQSILEERQNKNKSNIDTIKVKKHWWNRLFK